MNFVVLIKTRTKTRRFEQYPNNYKYNHLPSSLRRVVTSLTFFYTLVSVSVAPTTLNYPISKPTSNSDEGLEQKVEHERQSSVGSMESFVLLEEGSVELPEPSFLSASAECQTVYSFDTLAYIQDDTKSKASSRERTFYFQETLTQNEVSTKKDEDGLACFAKTVKCTRRGSSSDGSKSKRILNCVYFSKEFCTRKYNVQIKSKGTVCMPSKLVQLQPEFECGIGVGNKSTICQNSKALCLSLSPPPSQDPSKSKNPSATLVCLCPLGYTGPTCSRIDVDLFQIDRVDLDTVDLRNILLKYQQKDRYFIGATLLIILVVTISSVLIIVACCTFVFIRLSDFVNQTHFQTFQSHIGVFTSHGHDDEFENGVGRTGYNEGRLRRRQIFRQDVRVMPRRSFWSTCFGSSDEEEFESEFELRFGHVSV